MEPQSNCSHQCRLYLALTESLTYPFTGLGVTVGALVRGVGTMTRGDEIQQNRMMRLRIAGQAFTIFAFISGCALGWHGPVIETVENWKVCRQCCVPTVSYSLPLLIVYSLTRTPVPFCFLHVI